jgi:hypothetical protein
MAAQQRPDPNIAPAHQPWLDENAASIVFDNEALQTRADELNASIADPPHIFVSSIGPIPQDRANIIVDWPVPEGPLLPEQHQWELSRAVDVSLVHIRHEAWRRLINRWSIPGILGGITLAAAGNRYLDNDVAYYGGIGVLAISMIALTVANTRDKPQPPDEAPERPALRLEERSGPAPG